MPSIGFDKSEGNIYIIHYLAQESGKPIYLVNHRDVNHASEPTQKRAGREGNFQNRICVFATSTIFLTIHVERRFTVIRGHKTVRGLRIGLKYKRRNFGGKHVNESQ